MQKREEVIHQLQSFIGEEGISTLKIRPQEDRLLIKVFPLNYALLVRLAGMGLGILIILRLPQLAVIGLLLSLVSLFYFFVDLVPVTANSFHFENRELILTRLYGTQTRLSFSEIQKIGYKKSSQSFDMVRYRLFCVLATGEEVTLFDVHYEKQAKQIARLLAKVIRE
jgi:hypothetical protein